MKLIQTLGFYFIVLSQTASLASADPIEVSTFIQSSPQKVWNVMADFENYGRWNAWVSKLEGSLEVGSKIRAYDRAGRSLKLQITSINEPFEICWNDVTWFTHFGLGGWRCRRIVPLADRSGVQFVNHFEFTGVFGGALEHYTREYLTKGMTLENESLKKYVETGSTE